MTAARDTAARDGTRTCGAGARDAGPDDAVGSDRPGAGDGVGPGAGDGVGQGAAGSHAPGAPGAPHAGPSAGAVGSPATGSSIAGSSAPGAPGSGTPGAAGAADGRDASGAAEGAPIALDTRGLPEWLRRVAEAVATVQPRQFSRFLPPAEGGRQSAVLVLFGDAAATAPSAAGAPTAGSPTSEHPTSDPPTSEHPATTVAGDPGNAPAAPRPEVLLMERASSLRSHAGQPSFPGGALDPEDGDPAGSGPLRAALREAQEETGLDPSGVQLFATLPRLYIPVSDFVVTPVLGWWRTPSPVAPVDPAETARVFTVPVADLVAPANRATAVHPRGHEGPCFLVGDAVVWGFTAGVIDRILHFAGWERPWDHGRRVPLDMRA